MRIRCLTGPPDPETAVELARFEKEFTYPLGPDHSFSICHGTDYSLFFRSMGETRIYLAERSGKIIGALTAIRRIAQLADGSTIPSVYFCDAKIAAANRGGIVLGRLALTARDQALAAGYQAGYSVAMSGSIPTTALTGKLGIPSFQPLGELVVLRFETHSKLNLTARPDLHRHEISHHFQEADAALHSEISPQRINVAGASGTLVDTRRGKRLYRCDGLEILSAHLIGVTFESVQAQLELISAAVKSAGELGFPGLFLALPASDPGVAALSAAAFTVARATVYGTGLPVGQWQVETSEI